MKALTKNKGILIAVAIFIVAMFVYNLFFKQEVSLPSESQAVSIGDDLLKIYADLQKITFDQSSFSTPGYLYLQDYTTSVPEQPVGRRNPFDNTGRD